MTIEEKIYEVLVASVAVTALVPADRIKPPGNWQNLAKPYIVHVPVTVSLTRTHDGTAPLRGWPYQVSVFAATYPAARAIAKAVVAALEGWHADSPITEGVHISWDDQRHLYEPDTDTHQIALQFDVFEALT